MLIILEQSNKHRDTNNYVTKEASRDMENYTAYDDELLHKLQDVLLEIMDEFVRICEENKLQYFLVYGTAIGAVRHHGFIPWDDDMDVAMPREDFEKFIEICNADTTGKYEILNTNTDRRNCSSVTKFQKKNTTFIAEHAKYLKNNIGIAIDIFPFDEVVDSDEILQKQMQTARVWGRLLYLKGSGKPDIPYTGAKKVVAEAVCMFAHGLLKILPISSVRMFDNIQKISTKYRGKDTTHLYCFVAPVSVKHRWEKENVFPLKKEAFCGREYYIPNNNHQMLSDIYGDYMQLPPVEERVNHKPYKISFDA